MNIIKELENLEERAELVEQLRQEQLPLVMYGAGQMAVEVMRYLRMNDIKIDGVFVDDDYYLEGMEFEGNKIIPYIELVRSYSKVNVILGNSNYERIDILERKENINKVFYLFSASYGIYNKIPLNMIEKNIEEFETVYNLWADEASRKNYLAFLKTRISGNNQYILDLFSKEMNFFNNDVFCINGEEVFLDVGAYDGDTIRLFLKENSGKYKRIYALEPDKTNRDKLERYINRMKLHNVMITEKGAWNRKEKLNFYSNNDQISGMKSQGTILIDKETIVVEPLDTLFDYDDKVTILKINYFEGVREAVQGAEKILKNYEPKVAISVGYDCRNIRYIPLLIKQINPNYKLYIRYNRGMASALTLYGII